MAEELTLVGGVDRDLHGAELQCREEGHDLLGAVGEQGRDTITVPNADSRERVREARGLVVHPPRRVLLALEVQVSRHVQYVDLLALPLTGRNTYVDADVSPSLLRVEISGCRTVIHAAQAVDGAGRE